MKQIFIVALVAVMAIGCNTESDANFDGYIISGKLENVQAGSQVFLDLIDNKRVNVIDTAVLQKDNTFKMKGQVKDKSLVRLRVGMTPNNNVMLILGPKERVNLEADFQKLRTYDYKLTGSPESEQLHQLYQTIQSKGLQDKGYIREYVKSASSPLLAYIAINHLDVGEDYELYQELAKRMNSEMGELPLAKEFNGYVASMANVKNTAVGKEAPDIKLQSPEGSEIALSSLRGKIVLIDFWSSWCKPCRRENPNVVKVYNEYKNKGFDIYSVSLDNNKQKWLDAIEQDNLTWKSHVSDLGGWGSSAAALYNVKSIPQTFLVDKEGKIIAKNLRGAALETKLAELLGEA